MGAYQFGQVPMREATDGPARLTPAAAQAGNPGLFYFLFKMDFYLDCSANFEIP
jgi:hypothetical protein